MDTPALHAYARARLADSDGALDIAVANYRQVMAVDPESVVVALRSYRQAIEGGDMALALRAGQVLDAAGSLPRDGTLLLAVDALRRKDWASARSLAGRLREEGNFAFVAPVLLGWVSTADGSYAPPAVDPDDRFGRLTKRYVDEHAALQLLALGEADEAMPAIARALALQTGSVEEMRFAFALALARLGRRDQAQALLAGGGGNAAAAQAAIRKVRHGKAKMTPAQGFARLLARLSDDVASDSTRQVALTLARLATFADPVAADLRVTLAQRLAAVGHADQAIAEAERVERSSWLAPAADDVRVEALAAAGRQDEALALARELAARPDAGPARHMRLANVEAAAGSYEAAAQAYARARGLYPQGAAPWSLYLLEGSALERAGRWEEARAALSHAAMLAPEEPVVLNYLGYAQVERRQNVAAALDLLRKASALRPDDPSITDSLGWAHYIAGQTEKAVPVLEKAAAGAPGDATINEHLGDALWTAGRRFEARYAWTAAQVFAEGQAVARLAAKLRTGLSPELAAP